MVREHAHIHVKNRYSITTVMRKILIFYFLIFNFFKFFLNFILIFFFLFFFCKIFLKSETWSEGLVEWIENSLFKFNFFILICFNLKIFIA